MIRNPQFNDAQNPFLIKFNHISALYLSNPAFLFLSFEFDIFTNLTINFFKSKCGSINHRKQIKNFCTNEFSVSLKINLKLRKLKNLYLQNRSLNEKHRSKISCSFVQNWLVSCFHRWNWWDSLMFDLAKRDVLGLVPSLSRLLRRGFVGFEPCFSND